MAALIAADVAEERDVVVEATVAGSSALIGMIVVTTLAKGKCDALPPFFLSVPDAVQTP